ncbi:hypothetical protein D3874_08360 [Oleomonas cavernae]|uniref:Uncharacterized protein n=2 Tax=Oleomonas cavernae TaxID=2320859 RepID=A0A418WAJ2_9PROT|nr:hypothetical protein D3874_08360 [Oleomonas cavernae]
MAHITSYANNTKWRKLQQKMAGLASKAPIWQIKYLGLDHFGKSDGEWFYHFRLEEYEKIEWCDLTPAKSPDAISLSDIALICKMIGLETEVMENSVRVIGYRLT